MQKKKKPQQVQQEVSSSDWEKKMKKEAQKETLKKLSMWAGIAIASIAGLAILVALAGRGGPASNETATVNENIREVSAENDMILGNPDAKVTIIEYADFQCPACATYNPIINQILNTYPDDVRVVFRHFPLKSIHKNAQISGQAAYASWKLNKFKEMKDELFNNQDKWAESSDPREDFIAYAESVGMDGAEFEELMNSSEAENVVNTGAAEAIALGVNSTPTFFIAKKQVTVRDFDDFKALIDAELSGTQVEATTAPLQ